MKAIVAIVLALLSAPVSAQEVDTRRSASLFGEWWTPGFNARVRLEACGDAVCGHIVWVWDEVPPDIADKNPLVGRRVVEGMRLSAPGRFAQGKLYNPEDGREYKGSLELQAADRLRVDGCVLFICKSQVWRRADMLRCPPVAAP